MSRTKLSTVNHICFYLFGLINQRIHFYHVIAWLYFNQLTWLNKCWNKLSWNIKLFDNIKKYGDESCNNKWDVNTFMESSWKINKLIGSTTVLMHENTERIENYRISSNTKDEWKTTSQNSSGIYWLGSVLKFETKAIIHTFLLMFGQKMVKQSNALVKKNSRK